MEVGGVVLSVLVLVVQILMFRWMRKRTFLAAQEKIELMREIVKEFNLLQRSLSAYLSEWGPPQSPVQQDAGAEMKARKEALRAKIYGSRR